MIVRRLKFAVIKMKFIFYYEEQSTGADDDTDDIANQNEKTDDNDTHSLF